MPDPQFTPPTFLSTVSLTNILSTKKLDNQFEKVAPKLKDMYSNKGFVDASFEAMMESVGWVSSNAWCAFYVKLIYMQLYSFDREWLSINIGGGAVNNLYNVKNRNAVKDYRYIAITKNEKPQIGDVFCMGISGRGHTGIVVEVLGQSGNGWSVKTIEGNTSDAGVREGYRTRYLTRILQVGVAPTGSDQVMKGYWRRNFTQKELDNVVYDEAQGTYVMKSLSKRIEDKIVENYQNPFRTDNK